MYSLNIARNFNTLNMNCVNANTLDKYRAHYIVVLEEKIEEPADKMLSKVFDIFWRKKILNALIIYWSNDLHIVSFNPFTRMKLINFAANQTDLNVLFPEKANNLNGHQLKATIFYDETRATFNQNELEFTTLDGADGLLGKLFVKYMNATMVLSVPKDKIEIGEFLDNGTVTGCLGELVRREVDLGINIRFYRISQFKNLVEATVANGRDDICILVPRRGKETDIGNIFRAFTYYEWIVIVAAIPVFAAVYKMTQSRQPKSAKRQNIITICFQFIGWNLQQSTSTVPSSGLKRSLIALWVLYSLFITSLYHGKLSGNLIIPKDLPDIDSIQQLDKSNYKLISYTRYNKQIKEFLTDAKYNKTYKNLPHRLVNVSQDVFYREIKNKNRSIAYANKYHINIHLRRTLMENGETIFNHMKQCPVPYATVYGVIYGSPFKGRLNYIIRGAQEAGLIEKWDRVNYVKDKITQTKINSGHTLVAFTLTHLRTAFFVFIIGCILAISAFFVEIIRNDSRMNRTF